MTTPTTEALVAELPEPVRRYLHHALPKGFHVTRGVTLRMAGKIRVGFWLPFTAGQECDGRSFEWRARVGIGPLAPLEIVDCYANGAGSVTGRLLSRYELFRQADEHVHRSAAGRAALEAVLAPASLLPGRGVSWRAEEDEHIIASSDLEPEHIEVHMRIDQHGAVRAISAQRWGNIDKHSHGYLTFGGDVHAEQAFGDVVIPSHLTLGWRYGSEHYKPFFEAHIQTLQPDRSRNY